MNSEIEDGDSAAHRKEFQEIIRRKKLRRSKIRYSRAFLLTFAKFDVCKRLPPGGISPSVLLEVANETPRNLHESWRRSGDLSVDCKSEYSSLPAIERGSVLGQPYSLQPSWRNGESNSHRTRNSDAPQYKAGVLDQSSKEAPKIGPNQLRRSTNPYRPPHCHQVGSVKFDEKSLCKNNNTFQDLHFNTQKEISPRSSNMSRHIDQEINLPSECVTELGSYLSSNLYNAANLESDIGCSPNLPVCASEILGSIPKTANVKESSTLDTADDKPISDIQSSQLCCFAGLHSSEKVSAEISAERTKRIDDSNPCEFSFFDAFDFLTPSADDVTIVSTFEDNELTFEDVWSEVSAILRFDREMDLTLAAEYGETAELQILVSLPDEGSDTSISCPSSCDPIEGYNCGNGAASAADAEICLPDDYNCDDNANSDSDICLPDKHNCDDNANSEAEICWPDENSLISIDDMIAHDFWRPEDTKNSAKGNNLTSDQTDVYAKGSVIVDTSPHKKRSAPQYSTVSPLRGTKAPLPHQKSSVLQTYQSHLTSAAVIPPLHYQQAHMAFQMPLVPPVASIPSDVNWYSCTIMHHQPSTGCDFIHQYSLWQQPTAALIAYQC